MVYLFSPQKSSKAFITLCDASSSIIFSISLFSLLGYIFISFSLSISSPISKIFRSNSSSFSLFNSPISLGFQIVLQKCCPASKSNDTLPLITSLYKVLAFFLFMISSIKTPIYPLTSIDNNFFFPQYFSTSIHSRDKSLGGSLLITTSTIYSPSRIYSPSTTLILASSSFDTQAQSHILLHSHIALFVHYSSPAIVFSIAS